MLYLSFVNKEGPHQGIHVVAIGYLVGVCSFFPASGSKSSDSGHQTWWQVHVPTDPWCMLFIGVWIGATFSHCYHFYHWNIFWWPTFALMKYKLILPPLCCCLLGLQKSLPILDAIATMAQWIRPPRSTFLSNTTQHHPQCSPEWPCNSTGIHKTLQIPRRALKKPFRSLLRALGNSGPYYRMTGQIKEKRDIPAKSHKSGVRHAWNFGALVQLWANWRLILVKLETAHAFIWYCL